MYKLQRLILLFVDFGMEKCFHLKAALPCGVIGDLREIITLTITMILNLDSEAKSLLGDSHAISCRPTAGGCISEGIKNLWLCKGHYLYKAYMMW